MRVRQVVITAQNTGYRKIYNTRALPQGYRASYMYMYSLSLQSHPYLFLNTDIDVLFVVNRDPTAFRDRRGRLLPTKRKPSSSSRL
jgi:hypothetical protein